jgi:hypothetical protein
MGTNTLNDKAASDTIDQTWRNEINTALKLDHVPRNSSGAPLTEAGSLGTASYQWLNTYTKDLTIDGQAIDFSSLFTTNNRIKSCASRTYSSLPDIIRADGSAATCTVLATATDLVAVIDGVVTTSTADIEETGLTTAPSSNNTAFTDDGNLTGGSFGYYVGENNTLTIKNAGSEVTALVGQWVAFSYNGGASIICGYLKSSTELINVKNGFFFDDSGDPIYRVVLSDNQSLTLLKVGWVFLNSGGTTVSVTYKTPTFSGTEPASPATDDYWYNRGTDKWNRYSGSAWEEVARIPIGIVVMDSSNCIASRSFDLHKNFDSYNSIRCNTYSNTQAIGRVGGAISVYGTPINYNVQAPIWDITTDLENGQTESSSTPYFLYVSDDGKHYMSETKYLRRPDLRGMYHPFESWRCVGVVVNNGSSNLENANSRQDRGWEWAVGDTQVIADGKDFTVLNAKVVKYIAVGGGGGGRGSSGDGGDGGVTYFGSYATAGGGNGGSTSADMNGGLSLGDGALLTYGGGAGHLYFGGVSIFGGKTSAYGLGGNAYNSSTYGGGGGGGVIGIIDVSDDTYITATVGSGGSGGSGGGSAGGAGRVIVQVLEVKDDESFNI